MVANILSENDFETYFGPMLLTIFSIAGKEVAVLHTKDIPGTSEIPFCRIQSECCSHIFGNQECDCQEQILSSLQMICENKHGLLIFLRQEGMSLGLSCKIEKNKEDWRNYNEAVTVLKHYAIKSVYLISLDKNKTKALIDAGIRVKKNIWHKGHSVMLGDEMNRTVQRIKQGKFYNLFDIQLIDKHDYNKPKMLSIGDLNIDRYYRENKSKEPSISVGGSGYNAAKAFSEDFNTIVFGKVGQDDNGKRLINELRKTNIWHSIGIHPNKKTGLVEIIDTDDLTVPRHYHWEKVDNANDYDIKQLEQAITLFDIGENDYISIASYLFVQKAFEKSEIQDFLNIAITSGAKIIIDIARKSISNSVLKEFKKESFTKNTLFEYLQGVEPYVVVVEIQTLEALGFDTDNFKDEPKKLLRIWLDEFRSRNIICRYSSSGKFQEKIGVLSGDNFSILQTRSEHSDARFLVGKGDVMTARAFKNIREFEKINR